MNSLLKRQIRKYLPEEEATSAKMFNFLDAINRSYTNFDEHYVMQQRAMAISSEELYAANEQLKKEAKAQKEFIAKLKHVIETLKFYELPSNSSLDNVDLDGLKLVEFIDNQTREIVKINKQREKLLEELGHQNQELSDYAHMVSHDLKSPLRSIDALTAWISEDYKDKFDDDGRESLVLIRNNVEKMDTLISGILDYSTINKNQTEFYDVNIDKLVDNITSIMLVPQHITIEKTNKLPIVKGDKFRLQQLFQNLIDNAIKYNDKSEGRIEIGVEDDNTFWKFFVRDNGKGIDGVYFDKIFKTFQKLENNPESSGIGLSIVKKIVTLYGGKIWVESKLETGTTFYFTLKK
ncbi:sensor histidine kinase [Hyunsoonleella pacifica]|uniref:histidine kinase n=1 Tax=Hyunsoonleella pacifica TaxID=1080224 RepID=A0A4Q9FQ56_9FLAO|nr:ATP-binding protein [Hyunsoonleella pacifica]TBN17470.1 GHKL domain-containing protein [Hyunsoonleella pacifica]GGD11727.1 two-component sensor histidine kinase [Hyunsoonleella pacifica]